MGLQDTLNFADGVGMLERLVTMMNDEFGLRSIQVTAGIGNHTVAAVLGETGSDLSDDAVERHGGRDP